MTNSSSRGRDHLSAWLLAAGLTTLFCWCGCSRAGDRNATGPASPQLREDQTPAAPPPTQPPHQAAGSEGASPPGTPQPSGPGSGAGAAGGGAPASSMAASTPSLVEVKSWTGSGDAATEEFTVSGCCWRIWYYTGSPTVSRDRGLFQVQAQGVTEPVVFWVARDDLAKREYGSAWFSPGGKQVCGPEDTPPCDQTAQGPSVTYQLQIRSDNQDWQIRVEEITSRTPSSTPAGGSAPTAGGTQGAQGP